MQIIAPRPRALAGVSLDLEAIVCVHLESGYVHIGVRHIQLFRVDEFGQLVKRNLVHGDIPIA